MKVPNNLVASRPATSMARFGIAGHKSSFNGFRRW